MRPKLVVILGVVFNQPRYQFGQSQRISSLSEFGMYYIGLEKVLKTKVIERTIN